MTLRRRSDWTPIPAANAHKFVPSEVDGVAIHYNGPPVSKAALTDPRAFLRGILRFHKAAPRSWSDIAYNLAVDQRGNVWDLRGLRHRSGANGDEAVNRRYVAVYCVIGKGQKPSPEMLAGVRDAVAMVRAVYPHAREIKGHRDIRHGGTECPGSDLYAALKAGAFKPQPAVKELLEMKLTDKITIPARYDSNDTDQDVEVTVEDAFRRIYEWAWKAAHRP
jgi:hypothetical protein